MNVTSFFNFESDVSIHDSVIVFIEKWGSLYLNTYKIVSENDNEKLKDILNLQVLQFISMQNEFSSLKAKIERIKKTCENVNQKYNPILVWSSFISSHNELSKVAIAILSICPSEASVERSFSMQSDVHSLERNRLSIELVEAEMRIKFNIENC